MFKLKYELDPGLEMFATASRTTLAAITDKQIRELKEHVDRLNADNDAAYGKAWAIWADLRNDALKLYDSRSGVFLSIDKNPPPPPPDLTLVLDRVLRLISAAKETVVNE